MSGPKEQVTVEELLSQMSWLRVLALQLTKNPADANDLVQDTWMAASQRPPEARESVRPWLSKVARNGLRMNARSDERRRAREQATTQTQDEVATPEALVAKAELQRHLAELVLRLKEPYRSTVLLHFFEGLSLVEIARSQEIAASTARWRLKTALDQLRAELDQEASGRQGLWLLLAPLPHGALMTQKAKLVAPIALLLLLLLAVVFTWRATGGSDQESVPSAGHESHTLLSENSPPNGFSLKEVTSEFGPAWLVQANAPSRRIAGRVIFDGEPVADARVELANLATEVGFVDTPVQITDSHGQFDFGMKPAMEWSVRASASKHTSAVALVDVRNPSSSPPPEQLELELGPCEAIFAGTVKDSSGGPIAGARVATLPQAEGSALPGGASVTTGNAGNYELCVRPSWPLWMTIDVSADGYGAIEVQKRSSGHTEVNFELVPEASIVGQVVRDDTGAPVQNALVFVPKGPGVAEATAWRGTFTQADGHFTITGIAPGRHQVLARAEGLVMKGEGEMVAVSAAESLEGLEIRLSAGSTLRGVVRADGVPISGARITAHAALDRSHAPSAISQQDGSFVLTEVSQGFCRFSASPYAVISPERFLVQQERHDEIAIEVEELSAIVGRVIRQQSPVAGARIDIHGPGDTEMPKIYTDKAGRFEVQGLLPGPWTLFAASEREGAFGKAPQVIDLKRKETREVTIDLAFAAAIEGIVVDQNGAPAPGLSVLFTHAQADDQGTAITDAKGRFRAAMMSGSGYYRAQVRPSPDVSTSFAPASGGEFPLIFLKDSNSVVSNLVLAVKLQRESISGQVVDSVGTSVADARVSATMTAPGEKPRVYRWALDTATTTDVEGHFALENLPAGNYALQAHTPAGRQTTALDITAGSRNVTLILSKPGVIEGTLHGFASRPAVTATPISDGSFGVPIRAATNADSFSLRDLDPGSYLVTATGNTHAARAEVVVASGQTVALTLSSTDSARITGRVFDFKSKSPVQGMSCRVFPRTANAVTRATTGPDARTDERGEFTIPAAAAGDVVVRCTGLERLYSDGLRAVSLGPTEAVELDLPVVAWLDTVAQPIADVGADMDLDALVPQLTHIVSGGPTAKAGLQDGDIVTRVDHTSISELSPTGVRMLITNRKPGSKVSIQVSRAEEIIEAQFIVGASEQH